MNLGSSAIPHFMQHFRYKTAESEGMMVNKLKSSEIVDMARHHGQIIVECENHREAVSMISGIRGWLKYNDMVDKYKVSRDDLLIKVVLSETAS
jgi:hypothetical protein